MDDDLGFREPPPPPPQETPTSLSHDDGAYYVTLAITLGLGIPLGLILIAFLGWLYVKYERSIKHLFTNLRSFFSCIFCVPFFRDRRKAKQRGIEMLKLNRTKPSNNNNNNNNKPRRTDEESGGGEYGKKPHMQTHREFVNGLNNDGFHRVDVGRVPPAYETHYYGYGHDGGAGNNNYNNNNAGGFGNNNNAGGGWQPYAGFPGNNGAQCVMM